MKLLLIGSGNRATAYAAYLKDEIAYVCDPNIEKAGLLIKEYGMQNAESCPDYNGIKDIDGIIIAVPDYKHEEVFSKVAGEGLPILLEKPVSVSNESLKRLYNLGKEYKNSIILGFTLRYTFMYKTILRLLDEERIGRVISVEACETLDPVHAAKFFRRWHRNSRFSGGFLNTKCSHDMDMINLVTPGNPVMISSFGSNSIFRPGRGEERCSERCREFKTCKFVDNNIYKFSTADTGICPYNIDSDIVDHQVAAIEFDSGATAAFTVTMHSDKGNRHIRIHGSEGAIKASFDDQMVFLMIDGKEDQVFVPDDTAGSHGGGDRELCRIFTECIKSGKPINQLKDGITASAMALGADEARLSGRVVDLRLFADYIHNKK
jgi:predicted dehydrogenase